MNIPEGYRLIKEEDFQALLQRILFLEEKIIQQDKKIKELEARLAQNSSNSHKPPSSDGFQRNRSLREKTGRKPGGQKGHEGTRLEMVEYPDHLHLISPDACGHCGGELKDKVEKEIIRQVLDIPIQQLESTEYRVEHKKCKKCGRTTRGKFPANVTQQVQYGSRLQALLVYLNIYQIVPQERTTELVKDLFSALPSEGTVINHIDKCAINLAPHNERVRELLIGAEVVNFDGA